jgi:DICT domain-containing protein
VVCLGFSDHLETILAQEWKILIKFHRISFVTSCSKDTEVDASRPYKDVCPEK